MDIKNKVITLGLNPDVDKDLIPAAEKLATEYITSMRNLGAPICSTLEDQIRTCLVSIYVLGYKQCGHVISMECLKDSMEKLKTV